MGIFLSADNHYSLFPFSVRLLPVMRFPLTLHHFYIGKDSFKRRFFRRAGINAEPDLSGSFVHMADSHLAVRYAIPGALDTIVILPPAETIPHALHRCVYLCGCPIGISMIRDNASQILVLVIFILHRTFQPVITV